MRYSPFTPGNDILPYSSSSVVTDALPLEMLVPCGGITTPTCDPTHTTIIALSM